MKSIAWAILLAGILVSTSLDSIAKPDRVYSNLEGGFTIAVFTCFLISLMF